MSKEGSVLCVYVWAVSSEVNKIACVSRSVSGTSAVIANPWSDAATQCVVDYKINMSLSVTIQTKHRRNPTVRASMLFSRFLKNFGKF